MSPPRHKRLLSLFLPVVVVTTAVTSMITAPTASAAVEGPAATAANGAPTAGATGVLGLLQGQYDGYVFEPVKFEISGSTGIWSNRHGCGDQSPPSISWPNLKVVTATSIPRPVGDPYHAVTIVGQKTVCANGSWQTIPTSEFLFQAIVDGSSVTLRSSGGVSLTGPSMAGRGIDCDGDGQDKLTLPQLVQIATDAGLTGAALADFYGQPCGTVSVELDHSHEILPNGSLPVAGGNPGPVVPCDLVVDRLRAHVRIAGAALEAGSVAMVTDWCWNGREVFGRQGPGEPPAAASFQDPKHLQKPLLTCVYSGVKDDSVPHGWTDGTRRGFYTTGTVGFECSGMALSLGWGQNVTGGIEVPLSPNVDVTATQYVWADGTSEFVQCGRGALVKLQCGRP